MQPTAQTPFAMHSSYPPAKVHVVPLSLHDTGGSPPPPHLQILLPRIQSGVIFARTTWPVRINGSSLWRSSSVNPPATNTPRVRIGPGISLRYQLPDIAATLLFRIHYNPKTSTSCPPSIQDFGLDSGLTFWSPFLATSTIKNTGVPLWPDDKQQHAWHDPQRTLNIPSY